MPLRKGHLKDHLDIVPSNLTVIRRRTNVFLGLPKPHHPGPTHPFDVVFTTSKMRRKCINASSAEPNVADFGRPMIPSTFSLQDPPPSNATHKIQCFTSAPNDTETRPLNDVSDIDA
ncbi:hypothetical protein FB107DRAFT_272020 [Schizophyllum commune]